MKMNYTLAVITNSVLVGVLETVSILLVAYLDSVFNGRLMLKENIIKKRHYILWLKEDTYSDLHDCYKTLCLNQDERFVYESIRLFNQ